MAESFMDLLPIFYSSIFNYFEPQGWFIYCIGHF